MQNIHQRRWDVPNSLAGKTLAQSGIGAKTGLSVIAIKESDEVNTQLSAGTLLGKNAEIVMLGNKEMRNLFTKTFER